VAEEHAIEAGAEEVSLIEGDNQVYIARPDKCCSPNLQGTGKLLLDSALLLRIRIRAWKKFVHKCRENT
jgi:hypothetical protein